MIDFQPADVGYLQRAFSDAIEEARRRSELNMTTSAAIYEEQARNCKKLRDKILSTMDATVRASYPTTSRQQTKGGIVCRSVCRSIRANGVKWGHLDTMLHYENASS
ncbi:MAG: hypothetical protein H0T48_12535 [Gemmatimonadaceae bacterium]|nr:hypothetical protein [Gemmatimonadaceae bacterium]